MTAFPCKVKTTRGVAANQGRASGTIVAPARYRPRDDRPLVPVHRVRGEDELVLLRGERPALHVRVQLIAPPKPAALAAATFEERRDRGPIPRAVRRDALPQALVLLRASTRGYRDENVSARIRRDEARAKRRARDVRRRGRRESDGAFPRAPRGTRGKMSLTTAAGKRRDCARGDARGTSRTSGVHEFFFILSSPSSSTFVIVRVAHRARGN